VAVKGDEPQPSLATCARDFKPGSHVGSAIAGDRLARYAVALVPKSIMDWHTVLAGPIVRRVDAGSASIWLAVDEPCDVTLRIWNGLESAGTSRAPAFLGRRRTRRVGDRLHIVVVAAAGAFMPGQIYSYDVEIDNGSESKTLDALKLLADGPVDGKPHRALGYEPAMLPSFAACPLELTDLRMVHGSCRLPDNHRRDAMVWIDDLIADGRTSAINRPHQLVLSGDQIYADEPGALFLAVLSDAGNSVLGTHRDDSDDLVAKEELTVDGKSYPCDRTHFPGGWRRNFVVETARFTSVEAKSHVISLAEFCGYYLLAWSNTLWPDTYPAAGSFLSTAPPPVRGRPAKVVAPPGFDAGFQKDYDEWATYLDAFRDGLPYVRRVLANVPTFMMMDDHDVTDDWNLTALWRDRVYSTDLGRTILRNGLVSYAMCQGWGNDPAAFESGPNRDLLDAIEKLNPPDAQTFPDTQVAADLEQRLGLRGGEPTIQWHYHVDGPRHRLVVIDNRTRRSFAGRVTPPQNMMPSRIEDQIPEGPLPAGLEVLVLVAPLVVFGPPAFDELLGSLAFRIGDLVTYFSKRNDANTNQPGTWPDAVESWAYAPESFEALLAWLEPYKRVAILSGDLHYASTQGMTYWKKQATPPAQLEPPARFAQLISSAIKTEFQPAVVAASRVLGFAQKVYRDRIGIERLIYAEPDPPPVRLAPGQTAPRALRRRLKARPVLLPTEGWPTATAQVRPFDAAWRVEIIQDDRARADRPEPARAVPFDPSRPEADVTTSLEGYRRVAARQIRQLDQSNFRRQILFANNIAEIRFTRDAQGLSVEQHLFALPARPVAGTRPEVYALHSVRLDPRPDELPPTLPPEGPTS
jgi:hypothetical protein